MKVYVAEIGCYDAVNFAGVYDSPERAMAALPGEKWIQTEDTWTNELDWDDFVTITGVEVVNK